MSLALDADGEVMYLESLITNVLNKQRVAADRMWSSSCRVGRRANAIGWNTL